MLRQGITAAIGLLVGSGGGFFLAFTPMVDGTGEEPAISVGRAVSERGPVVRHLAEPPPCPPAPSAPELEVLTRQVEALEGDLSEVELDVDSLVGVAVSFDGLPLERQPLAMEERLREVLDDLGRGEIYYVDCSEQPCVGVLEVVVPSFDREHFGVFTDAVQEAFGTDDLNFWAMSDESDDGGVRVQLALPLDHANGSAENPRRNQHRADQMLWDAYNAGSTR